MDDVKTLIFKLNAVINGAGCTDGERDNARRLRDRLLSNAGLKLEDLDPPAEKQTYWLRYENQYERRLISQILARIRDCQVDSWRSRRFPHHIGLEMTPDEYEAVKVKYAALRKGLAAEMDLCYSAFVQANHLGISPKEKAEGYTMSKKERDELNALLLRADLMNKIKVPETRKSRLLAADPESIVKGVSDGK